MTESIQGECNAHGRIHAQANWSDPESAAEEPAVGGVADLRVMQSFTRLLEIQRDLAVDLLKCKDLREFLHMLLSSATKLPGFDCGGVYMLDEETGGLCLIAHCGLSEEFVRQAASYAADSPQAEMVRRGSLLYAVRSDLSPEMAGMIAGEGLEALAVVPLRDHSRVIASLNVSSHRHLQIDMASRVALETMAALGEGTIGLLQEREARRAAHEAMVEARDALELRVADRTSELSAANAVLREKTTRLELALDASQAGTWSWVVGSDTVVWDNRERSLFGFENDVPISFEQCIARIVPEDRAVVLEAVRAISAPGSENHWSQEYRIEHPLLGERWIAGLGRIERDEEGRALMIVGVNLDITERKQAEQDMRTLNHTLERRVAERTRALHRSEARFRSLAEATFEGIAVTERGILVDGNPQLAMIHGCELAEMIGRPVSDFVAPESKAVVAERMREHTEATYEFVGLRMDGTKFPGEVHTCTRTWQGKNLRVAALRDLTLVKQTDARLLAKKTELHHAQRLALVSEISAGIIHQISQPLCGMGINLAAALNKIDACERACRSLELIRCAEADVDRMRDAVIHLRALANPEQRTREHTDFNHLVDGVLGLLRQEAENRQIRIEVGFGRALPSVQVDAVQLSQVILNLLRNAFDACDDCPPERRMVAITTRADAGSGIELCVRDSGTGILPEIQSRLFSPFFTTKPDGLGIGLRLSKTIVHAHGGGIEASNNPDGIGASFRVTLPVNAGSDHTKV